MLSHHSYKQAGNIMFGLNMSLKTTLFCSLIITLITRILYFFMDRLKMSFQIIITDKFFVTKTARILNIFVLRLNMFLEMFITLITRILYIIVISLPSLFLFQERQYIFLIEILSNSSHSDLRKKTEMAEE